MLVAMTFSPAIRPVPFLLLLAVAVPIALFGQRGARPPVAEAVTLTPAAVEQGSPELIRVHLPHPMARVEGEWLGRKLEFFAGRNAGDWFALGGVDVEAKAGPSQLRVTAFEVATPGKASDLSLAVTIHPAHYRTGAITVQPKFVEPGPEEQKLIDAARRAKEKAFAVSAATPLWSGSFQAPVKAQATDSFGTRRMFNGKLASIHQGTDFRAATGTAVLAGNSGTVVLAQPLYYEGNCVMVDHGLGLTSISMHLSRIDVKPGQKIAKGQQLGLSGATGRVTGPHLHWAIRWEGVYLDPAKLLRLDLSRLP